MAGTGVDETIVRLDNVGVTYPVPAAFRRCAQPPLPLPSMT
jgi:hypothetical protein